MRYPARPLLPLQRAPNRARLLRMLTLLALVSSVLAGCGRTATRTTASTPTVPATPTAAPLVSVAEAWGADPPHTAFTSRIDERHYMPYLSLSPDGRSALGYEVTLINGDPTPTLPAEAGSLDLATHLFTRIGVASMAKCVGNSCYVTSFDFYINCCKTDGRYLVAMGTGYPGQMCGPCVASYDTQTHTLWQITANSTSPRMDVGLVDHGLMAAWSSQGILVADLGKRTVRLLPGTNGATKLDLFTWPYVISGAPAGPPRNTTEIDMPLQVHNLATGAATALPQVHGTLLTLQGSTLYYSENVGDVPTGDIVLNALDLRAGSGAQPRVLARLPGKPHLGRPSEIAFAGTTLFFTTYDSRAGTWGITTLYAVDAQAPSPRVQTVATIEGDVGDVRAANARLVLLREYIAWDRAERRFVNLKTYVPPNTYTTTPAMDLVGDTLFLAAPLNHPKTRSYVGALFDTTRLPVRGG